MAGELPLLEAEPPHLERALALRNLHPELQVVTVRFCRRLKPSKRQTLAPVGRAVKSHNVIISDRIGVTIDESQGTGGRTSMISQRSGPDRGTRHRCARMPN